MSNTTNVSGYYNGNRYSIQLVISKLNITLTLKPGEYIMDRQKRKINDPYFEKYVNSKQLHKETSEKQVPLIIIPEVTNTGIVTQPNNPVRAVSTWTRDNKGHRQPVLTQPEPAAPVRAESVAELPAVVVSSSHSSVTPMSMDEARRLGHAGRVRLVPEDYGVTDTTGVPPSGIPQMRYSIDPKMNKNVKPLPKDLLALQKGDPNASTKTQLVAGLTQSAGVPPPEDGSGNPFNNTGVVTAPPDSPVTSGRPLMENEPDAVAEPDVEVLLPEPVLDETPPARPPARAGAPPPMRPLTPKNKFVCMACGAPHKFRSMLLTHAQKNHPQQVNAIMAAYPLSTE